MNCHRDGWLSLFGWRSEQWDGETDLKIAGLQTDDIGDRQQVAEGKKGGERKRDYTALYHERDKENE